MAGKKTQERTNGHEELPDVTRLKTRRLLKVMLSDAEERQLGKDGALQRQLSARISDEFDGVKSEFKSKIEKCEAEQNRIATLLNNGYEYRDVECEVVSYFTDGVVRVVRLDTGDTVEERAMTELERQRELPMGAGA